jgi:hypothetical protein
VVAESRPALGEQHRVPASGPHLLHRVRHVSRRHELPLLDIHDPARAARGHEQVRLTAQERRYLQHVRRLGHRLDLPDLVNVGHHRHAERVAHLGQDLERALEADRPERADRGAVGLVEARLEHERDAGSCARRL